jgi:hypothetical protein
MSSYSLLHNEGNLLLHAGVAGALCGGMTPVIRHPCHANSVSRSQNGLTELLKSWESLSLGIEELTKLGDNHAPVLTEKYYAHPKGGHVTSHKTIRYSYEAQNFYSIHKEA